MINNLTPLGHKPITNYFGLNMYGFQGSRYYFSKENNNSHSAIRRPKPVDKEIGGEKIHQPITGQAIELKWNMQCSSCCVSHYKPLNLRQVRSGRERRSQKQIPTTIEGGA